MPVPGQLGWQVHGGLDLPVAVHIHEPVDEAAPIVDGLAVDRQAGMLETSSEHARRRDVEPEILELSGR